MYRQPGENRSCGLTGRSTRTHKCSRALRALASCAPVSSNVSPHMIRVTSSDEFKRLLEALARDVGDANIHWRLYRDLDAELQQHDQVRNQTRTFWYLTLNAHSFTAVECLCRAFDQNDSALHLHSWLKTIEANLHFFDVPEFKKRLADNPFVESLAESVRIPDRAQLAVDIALCSATDPKVKALQIHRNNITAHRNARMTVQGRPISDEFGISVEVFEALLNRAHEIINRYSSLFTAATYSRKMIGHDDYRYIFKCVQDAVARWDRGNEG